MVIPRKTPIPIPRVQDLGNSGRWKICVIDAWVCMIKSVNIIFDENPWCGQGFSFTSEPKSPYDMMFNHSRLGLARSKIARAKPDPKASPI